MIVSFLTSCYNDDDWAQYTHYTKKLDIPINSQPNSISSIEDEITIIANSYDENTRLTQVIATFNNIEQLNRRKGIIEFFFFKNSDNKKINQATNVIIRFNMETNKVYEIEFEKGHGKRVGGIEIPISKDISEKLFEDIFMMLENDVEYTEKLLKISPSLKYIFMDDRLKVFLYDSDKNEGPVLRYETSI